MCVRVIGNMAKDIGMTICKMSFLPCLVALLAFHPYVLFSVVLVWLHIML